MIIRDNYRYSGELQIQFDEAAAAAVTDALTIPKTCAELSPIVTVVALQLFAYHVARLRGCEIDQPRNLAKSVTVE